MLAVWNYYWWGIPLPVPRGPHSGLWDKGTVMPHLREGRGDMGRKSPARARAGTLPITIWPATLEASPAPGQATPNLFHNFHTLCGMFVFCLPFPSKIHEIVQYLSVLLAWLHPLHSLHQPGWEWHWCSRLRAFFLHTLVSAVWDSGQGIWGRDQCHSHRRSLVFHYCKLRVGPWASTTLPCLSILLYAMMLFRELCEMVPEKGLVEWLDYYSCLLSYHGDKGGIVSWSLPTGAWHPPCHINYSFVLLASLELSKICLSNKISVPRTLSLSFLARWGSLSQIALLFSHSQPVKLKVLKGDTCPQYKI